MVKKKPKPRERMEEFIEDEKKILTEKEKEFNKRLSKEIETGRKALDEETAEFKKNVRLHPLEYVAGAFIIGLVIGKLTK